MAVHHHHVHFLSHLSIGTQTNSIHLYISRDGLLSSLAGSGSHLSYKLNTNTKFDIPSSQFGVTKEDNEEVIS
jgi:hypothetical protein